MDYVQLTREEYDLLRKTRDAMCYIHGVLSVPADSEPTLRLVMERVKDRVQEVCHERLP